MMDFGALPPEVNSSRMFSGPGSAPMMAAAAGWNALAAELSSAARDYDSLVRQLTGDEWLGPASESMTAAVTPYVTWMEGAAGQAEQAATQARQAAAAYEAALAATVHPAQVTANRTQLMELVATNVIGQNTAAIAATEAQYGQMWAQDATAMYSYAAHSATAAQVTPFSPPAPVANPGGTPTQGAVVAGTSAGTSAQSTLSRLISALPQTLQGLASPAASSYPGITPGPLGQYLFKLLGVDASNMNWLQAEGAVFRTWIGPAYNTMGEPYFATGMGNTLLSLNKALAPPVPALPKEIIIPPVEKVSDIAGGLGGGAAGTPASATLGAATPVGRLSVPAAWMAATPAAPPAAVTASPGITVSNAPAAGDSLAALPPMTGSAGVRGFGASPRYGFPIKVMATPPAAG